MSKVLNMFRAFSMEQIEGYNNLSDWQKDLFDIIYKKHLRSIDSEKRENYTESCIEKIEGEVSILIVWFNNGERFLYLPERTWIKVPS